LLLSHRQDEPATITPLSSLWASLSSASMALVWVGLASGEAGSPLSLKYGGSLDDEDEDDAKDDEQKDDAKDQGQGELDACLGWLLS